MGIYNGKSLTRIKQELNLKIDYYFLVLFTISMIVDDALSYCCTKTIISLSDKILVSFF